ncbi:MAG TPA: FtsX-like permease family protein, partial [Opitutus sp.]|nr:FtsX-like permease family protein [Opitutus sp.]
PARFQSYVPLAQATWSYVMLVVRADAPAETLVSPIRLAVSELDPDLALKDLMPVPHFIRRSTQDLQTINQLLVGFASLGLFLAALGIYGVVTRLVAQRTSEIGIRMALGAQLSDIARLILGAGLRLVLIGSGLGLLGAIALARFLSSSMPGLSSNGVSAIAAATAVLIAAATLACWLPTRRATQVNPIIALRSE